LRYSLASSSFSGNKATPFNLEKAGGYVAIHREEQMRLAKMEGRTTYYRVMGDWAR
jgi:hypothetical protein